MTKIELIKEIEEIFSEMEDIKSSANNLNQDIQKLYKRMENLPESANEITDDNEE